MQDSAERKLPETPAATSIATVFENHQATSICEEGRGDVGSLSELLLKERQAQKQFSSALTSSLLSLSNR